MNQRTIDLSSRKNRIAAVAALVACLAASALAARSFFANTVALRAEYKEIAAFAVRSAPADPQARTAHAALLERTFFPDDLPKSLAEYETAVALSPADYALWLELGRARERAGMTDRAESALRKSLALAPNYSRVQWALGNFLLRRERLDESFELIRKAAAGDPQYAAAAVSGAWSIFDGDIGQLRRLAGDSPALGAAAAGLLAREKRFDEAVGFWNGVAPAARRERFRETGDDIYRRMVEARRYADALAVYTSLGTERELGVGRITDGGFESQSKTPGEFEWRIADGTEPAVGVDNVQRREGGLSLAIVFKSPDGKAFRNITQTIVVEPGRRYSFEGYFRSELNTAATLRWEIADAADGKTIAATDDIAERSDWAAIRAGFTAPASGAVVLRLARSACKTMLCPISGRVWFDDFRLN